MPISIQLIIDASSDEDLVMRSKRQNNI